MQECRLRRCVLGGPRIYRAVLAHRLDHDRGPRLCSFQVLQRVVARGRPDQAGQHRCFGQRQLGQVLAEIEPGSREHAIGAVPKKDAVEITREDLILAELRIEPHCRQRFAELV